MSESNGVLRIGRKGMVKFAFGDEALDPPPLVFEVDIVEVYEEWCQLDRSMRQADGEVPGDQQVAYAGTKRSFAQGVVAAAYLKVGRQDAPALSYAEAFEFIAKITEEVGKLRDFLQPKFPGRPSSQESTAIRFEQ